MFRVSRLLVVAVLTLAVARPASASAIPAPLFTVAGVVNNGGLGTFVACTNGDAVPVTVGVEVFGPSGASLNNPTSTAVNVAPQATVLFGTTPAGGLAVDINLGIGNVEKGSAHILTTSKKIVCSPFLADFVNNPPTSMTRLTISAKGKEKGD